MCFRKIFHSLFFVFICLLLYLRALRLLFCVFASWLLLFFVCLDGREGKQQGKSKTRGFLENNNILERKLPGCQLFKCWYLPTNTADVGQLTGKYKERVSWGSKGGLLAA